MIELMTSDEELLFAYQRRDDKAALERLIARKFEAGYRRALALLGDPAAADDALQEALISLIRGARRFREGSAFEPWWSRILINRIRNEARKLKAKKRRDIIVGQRARSRPARDNDHSALHAGLAELPLDLREALVLRYLEGRSHKQVAAALEIPAGTASSRIRRGLDQLRSKLEVAGHGGLLAGLEAMLKKLGEDAVSVPKRPSLLALESLALKATIGAIFAKAALAGVALCLLIGFHRLIVSHSARTADERTGSMRAPTSGRVQAGSSALQTAREARGQARSTAAEAISEMGPEAATAETSAASKAPENGPALAKGRGGLFLRLRSEAGPLAEGTAEIISTHYKYELPDRQAFEGGALSFLDLPAGPVRFVVRVAGFAPAGVVVEIRDGQRIERALDLVSGLGLTGDLQVPAGTDREDIRVTASARFALGASDVSLLYYEGAVIEGRYRFANLPPGRYSIEASGRRLEGEAAVELRGDQEGPTIVLERKAAPVVVRGRLFDTAGRPIFRASVRLSPLESPKPHTSSLLSRSSGRFKTELAPGRYELRIKSHSQLLARRRIDLREDLDLGDLYIPVRTRLDVLVLDGSGRPLKNASVRARSCSANAKLRGVRDRTSEEFIYGFESGDSQVTDSDGRMLFVNLPPGPVEVYAKTRSKLSAIQRARVAEGALATAVCRVDQAPASLRVKSDRARGMTVILSPADLSSALPLREGSISMGGALIFDELPAGDYLISTPGEDDQPVTLAAGERRELELALAEDRAPLILIADELAEGETGWAEVKWSDRAGEEVSFGAELARRSRFGSVPPGPILIDVYVPGQQTRKPYQHFRLRRRATVLPGGSEVSLRWPRRDAIARGVLAEGQIAVFVGEDAIFQFGAGAAGFEGRLPAGRYRAYAVESWLEEVSYKAPPLATEVTLRSGEEAVITRIPLRIKAARKR